MLFLRAGSRAGGEVPGSLLFVGTVAKGSGLLSASEVGFCSLYLPQLIHMLLILAEKGSCSVWKFSDSRASWTAGPVVTISQTASPVSPHLPGLLLFDFEAMSYI